MRYFASLIKCVLSANDNCRAVHAGHFFLKISSQHYNEYNCRHTSWTAFVTSKVQVCQVVLTTNTTQHTRPQVRTKQCVAQYGNLANYWACTENSRLWPWTEPEDNSASKTMTSSVSECRSGCCQEMATDHHSLHRLHWMAGGISKVPFFVVGVLSTRLYRWRRPLLKEAYSHLITCHCYTIQVV